MSAGTPELEATLVEHAYRGARVQSILRAVLVAFVALTVISMPPAFDATGCYVIVACYAAWSVAVGVLIHRRGLIRFVWLSLFVDVAFLATLAIVADNSAAESWTADVLVNGFFLIPLLAATQLRAWVCAAVALPTVGVYLLTSIVTKESNTDPWSAIVLSTLLLAGLAVGAVLLSRVQRSRVATISDLVAERSSLLTELLGVEDRERRNLAETLHDGALQYVLAARMDLEDAQDSRQPESFDRVDHALTQSAQLLRSTLTQLHPDVLEQAGLLTALHDLARTTRSRTRLRVEVDARGWGEEVRTSADALLLRTAQELVTNVVKHAEAATVRIELGWQGSDAVLTVSDDGRGIAEGQLEQRLREGHIGLASRRIRLEAAGGRFDVRAADPTGTVVEVRAPATVIV
ncbi:MAG: ATP-binding protein [Propionibacteriaceae bacterium]